MDFASSARTISVAFRQLPIRRGVRRSRLLWTGKNSGLYAW